MGLFSWLRKKKEVSAEKREDLKTLGILVGSSDELQTRIQRRREFYEKIAILRKEVIFHNRKPLPPEKHMAVLLRTIDQIDYLLKECAVPWGRAGSVEWYRRAMAGWEGLLADLKSYALMTYHIMKKKKETTEKWGLLRDVRIVLTKYLVRYAQFIEAASYMAEDVTPKYNVVVVTPPTVERPPTTIQMPRPLERDLTSSYAEYSTEEEE